MMRINAVNEKFKSVNPKLTITDGLVFSVHLGDNENLVVDYFIITMVSYMEIQELYINLMKDLNQQLESLSLFN